ncbi:MAG: hypothetical protein R6U63_02465 [Longimicrobiales bacterium]
MIMHRLAPILLMASVAAADPAVGQGIPENIPDKPGESLADRHRERMVERYRGLLGRFFTGGSFAVAPVSGPAYQMNAGLGLTFQNGDAVLFSAGARAAPPDPDSPLAAKGWNEGAWLAGLGYELSGTRVFGSTPLGWRTALGLGVGVMHGTDLSAATLEVAPTYALMVRHGWSVPVGLRLSVSTLDSRDANATVTRGFLGLQIGVRWHLVRRERTD